MCGKRLFFTVCPCKAWLVPLLFATTVNAIDEKWLIVEASSQIKDKVHGVLGYETHRTDTFYHQEVTLRLDYVYNDHFIIGPGYKQLLVFDGLQWKKEQRPFLEMTLISPKFQTLKIDTRSRIEFREREDKDSTYRYRNRLRLRSNINPYINPWIAWEGFWQDNTEKHRFGIGWTFKVWSLSIDPFYGYEIQDGRDDIQFIGLGIKLK